MHRIQAPKLLACRANQQATSHTITRSLRVSFLLGSIAMAVSIASMNLAWAVEETPSNVDTKASEASKSDNQDDSLTLKSLSQIIAKRQYEQAIEKIEAFRKAHPDDPKLADFDRSLLAGLRYAKAEIAIPQYKRIIEQTLRAETLSLAEAACLSSATSQHVAQDKELSDDEKLSMLDRASKKLSSLKPQTAPYAAIMLKMLTSDKIRQLNMMGRHDEAKKLLDQSLATATQAMDDGRKTSIPSYLMVANDYFSQLRSHFPDESESVITKANEVAEDFIHREDIQATDFGVYWSFKSNVISTLTRVDVDRSVVLFEELSNSTKELEERLDEAEIKKITVYTRNIGLLKSRIDAALKHQRLIGTPAPEIDGEHFVAANPVTMSGLRGKVVLIDFWAVWCGPCIATFPHLIEWHEKYSDKGLVILGATNRYNYRWDDENNKATRAPQGEEVSIEEELAMLEKFREQHKLHHGFFVTPKGSRYSAEYGVTGIPQAALIDKEGKVQMIRIGSGSANAMALEAKIQELLEQ